MTDQTDTKTVAPTVRKYRVRTLKLVPTAARPAPTDDQPLTLTDAQRTQSGRVLYRVPRGSELVLKDGKPVGITVTVGRAMQFTITGDPEVLDAYDREKGIPIQGDLTVTRSAVYPYRIERIHLSAVGSSNWPPYVLRAFADLEENFSFDRGEQGWVFRLSACIFKLVRNEMEMPVQQAA